MPEIDHKASKMKHLYLEVGGTPVLVMAGQGNLYGWLVEDNSGDDIFLQVYDTVSMDPNVLNGLTPSFTIRVKADNAMGKDVNDTAYEHFKNGCVVRVSASRTGATAPLQPASCQFWAVNNPFA